MSRKAFASVVRRKQRVGSIQARGQRLQSSRATFALQKMGCHTQYVARPQPLELEGEQHLVVQVEHIIQVGHRCLLTGLAYLWTRPAPIGSVWVGSEPGRPSTGLSPKGCIVTQFGDPTGSFRNWDMEVPVELVLRKVA